MGDDMGFGMGPYHPPYHPSKPISSPISSLSTGMIWGMIWLIVHKNVKIVVLSSKSTVPAGDLDLEKYSLWIICLGLNHPWASVLLLIILNIS